MRKVKWVVRLRVQHDLDYEDWYGVSLALDGMRYISMVIK